MKALIQGWLEPYQLAHADLIYVAIVLGLIVLTSLVLHVILHSVVLRAISYSTRNSEQLWRQALYKNRLFNRIALVFQGVILYVQANIWLAPDSDALAFIQILTELWILLFALLSLFALLNALEEIFMPTSIGRRMPLRGISQSIKLIAALVAIIFGISLVIDKSPLILFSGLGAMTAVLLLVFKDAILGFVAGIQLAANNMLSLGDWLEMPKYGADGDVIDISLTTVKVRNWDNTITTVPAYALISDSFKNWRGMSESGGRRIKRAVYIDATSVKFLQQEDIQRLRRAALLSDYIEEKIRDIEADNQQSGIDLEYPVNGRRLTNLGTFRAYLSAYLRNHKNIHKGMTQMVRQLEPKAEGIPLEVYAFSNDTSWANYERIQADIFDHIFAVIPEFGLRVYQSPSGYDMQHMAHQVGPLNSSDQAPT
ncbi:mechanosensitive ion channel family protein [Cellvibrio japonicus]|uniref:Mechanosensing system component YbdG n=1 Tax=Cellvibrio japonicus (strain Ueda107) TaxID=498211 RepID=B3PGB2_CELJU|nr:mechanosensitive ion channel family protein [Cellvibrio japonicus]ACE85490.1 transporter, small conductance mechanosensitive ion channel (MscS) family [Cellvibrio japonicus Ueda107]QEI10911.1 mechanosensitive ion channel family protein [Cellvibrio japonicus]QEI14487.1 mechanosensitive ion channel family protein [Cellvibrio japonicus]QEI18065.1 mechanosensitive ion channel family protein [Cellvibrio japonicus]